MRGRLDSLCRLALACLAIMGCAIPSAGHAADPEVVRLWPANPPGPPPLNEPETTSREQSGENTISIVRNVSTPTLTVVRPAPGKANGTAVVVLPGGAFMALAWDLEGLEVAQWLADRGITAFLLKYRVSPLDPSLKLPPGDLAAVINALQPKRKLAVADAAQAVAHIRANAAKYQVARDRIGMIGFSAGAIATLGLVLEGDPASRPDFAAPIYGMPMIDAPAVPQNAPPLFLVHAQDDPLVPASASLEIAQLWGKAMRPVELHLYEKGGHGFGMRPKDRPVDRWPAAFDAWLKSRGLLDRQVIAKP